MAALLLVAGALLAASGAGDGGAAAGAAAGALAAAGGAGDGGAAAGAAAGALAAAGGAGDGGAAAGAAAADEATWRALWAGALLALPEPALGSSSADVVAQLGDVAYLHCAVRDLGERGISWIRRRDWHIISSGLLMYTNDERFQVLHSEGADDWMLQIKYVQKRDNGTYECQASTPRGVVSRQVALLVAVPEAFILGGDEHHVDAGSDLSLVCIVEKSPVPPQYVFWYHNARMINYDGGGGGGGGGVAVRTEPGGKTQSTLTVHAAGAAHSGNYTCRAANAEPATITVYVSAGSDKMAATLARGTTAPPPRPAHPALLPLLLLLRLAASEVV